MPLLNRLPRTAPPDAEEVKQRLIEEWQRPRERGEPIIVEEQTPGGRGLRVHVIQKDWGHLNHIQRGEVIMDVIEEMRGIDEALRVVVALGLTPREAHSMGIDVSAYTRVPKGAEPSVKPVAAGASA